jgi:hypothetical protein
MVPRQRCTRVDSRRPDADREQAQHAATASSCSAYVGEIRHYLGRIELISYAAQDITFYRQGILHLQ